MTLAEAATAAGMSAEHLRNVISRGFGPKHTGNLYQPASLRFERDDVVAWVKTIRDLP